MTGVGAPAGKVQPDAHRPGPAARVLRLPRRALGASADL